ncbi:MAG: glycoside hydrolase family 5 protein [Treponema sp.]|nr:glycoside hydrolase family 5 protein [Treponema sp.]
MTTKKTILVTLAVFSLLLAACSSSGSGFSLDHVPAVPYAVRDVQQESVSGKSAFDYFRDERILVGWNLGNTLDSHNNGIAGETVWGNPAANQEIMNGVKAAGFDIIRIPITWMGSIGAAPDHVISGQRLRRAGDVVDMARNAGLKVIINLHHDGSTPEYGQDQGWLSVFKAYRNPSEYRRITLQFARMWDQIAAYFQNYGDWLMFEPMNEIHDGGWGWSTDFKMFPSLQTDIINNWNRIFTSRVRAAGGNNTERFLLIPAYCTIPGQTLADTYVLPEDSAVGKLIVKFHYYDPHEFSIQGTRSAWGTQQDRLKVVEDFAPFKPRYIDNKIPVVIGESGAVLQLYPNDPAREALARQNRLDYTTHVFATAHRYGLVPIYWDNGLTRGNGEKFGLFDRRTGQPNSQESRALITAMVNAVK